MRYEVLIGFMRIGCHMSVLVSADKEFESGPKAMELFERHFALTSSTNTAFVMDVTERPDMV